MTESDEQWRKRRVSMISVQHDRNLRQMAENQKVFRRNEDARENPFKTSTCRICSNEVILPRSGTHSHKPEGAWIHLELPPQLHPAVPRGTSLKVNEQVNP